MTHTMTELLDRLASAPTSQIDTLVQDRLRKVKTAADLKTILDDCARYSLASDFAMQAMDLVWKTMPKQETEQ